MPPHPILATAPSLDALPALGAYRPAIREESLRSAASFRGDAGLPLTAWRGHSGRRYVVGIHALERAEPADLAEHVVLFVCRGQDGTSSIVGEPAHNLTEACAEHLLEERCGLGANEVHVHRLAEDWDRHVIAADLSADLYGAR